MPSGRPQYAAEPQRNRPDGSSIRCENSRGLVTDTWPYVKREGTEARSDVTVTYLCSSLAAGTPGITSPEVAETSSLLAGLTATQPNQPGLN